MNINPSLLKQMSWALNYIEENLTEKINLEDIAKSACFSLFHFSRVFQFMTRFSPYDYLIRRRIHEAALKLINTDLKIIEIAYEYAFASPEVFNRAFKRVYQCQPNEYRKNQQFIPHLFSFKAEFISVIHENITSQIVIEKHNSEIFSIILLSDEEHKDNAEISKIQAFLSRDDKLCILNREIKAKPVFWISEPYLSNIPTNQLLLQIKASSYIKFNFSGDAESLSRSLEYIDHIYTPRFSHFYDNLVIFKKATKNSLEVYVQLL